MKSRSLSIRARILVLLLAPLLPLLGIWFSSTNESFGSALDLLDSRTTADDAGVPANVVLTEIQAERKLSVVHLGQTVPPALVTQRVKTDEAIAYFQRVSASARLRDAATPLTMQHLGRLNESLDRINLMRTGIDEGRFTRVQTMENFNEIIDRGYAMYSSIGGVNDQELARQAGTIIALTEAREMLKREDALVTGMLVAGTTTIPEIVEMVQAIGLNRYLLANATRNLSGEDQAAYQELVSGVPYQNLRSMEERLIAQTSPRLPLPIDALWWQSTFEEVDRQLFELGDVATQRTIAAATTTAVGVLLRLAIAGGLGLVVIIILIIISIRIARSLIRRITALRVRALDLAHESLPQVVVRLRQGEKVEVPPVPGPAESDELGQLSNAFEAVHRTAIESAVQEAALRTGLSQVFLNIGRRSQTLVHRQLSLLETMERRVTDPGELEEIYRVDHLAVRMRRYAEDLVILAGAVPGRGWRYPVPLSDVLRSAMSEVEDYTRISVVSVPDVALAGRAVSDVIHLLAELLENATTFSPKDTQVKLVGQMLPNGFAVEIEDRGVGMPVQDLAEANKRLANPPDFDPARSSRLGLFVVARLAARHGVKVSLQSSAYGGITAVALLPNEIVVKTSHEMPALTAAPTSDSVIDADAVLEDTEAMSVISAFPAPRRERPIAASAEGLPVRARQASLAPQLREAPTPLEVEAYPARPAEHTRSLLSALQAGVSRGRQEAANQNEEEGQ